MKLLAIDDDPQTLALIRAALKERDLEIITVADPLEGLEVIRRQHPEIVLLDLMLPKVHGDQICRAARASRLPTSIIVLSAKNQEEDIVRGLELGADDYMTKPFKIRELIARAKRLCTRR